MLKPFLSLLALLASTTALGADPWVEGKHYFVIQPAAPYAPQEGKVEVTEVFSYGCPACYRVHPFIVQLAAKLPPSATLDFLPASFRPDEAWPMFQRAYYAAQSLGIADETHDAALDAVWKTGELATMDAATRRAKNPLPSIEDAAAFYARAAGIEAAEFLAAARSFGVDAKMRRADQLVRTWKIDSTPSLVINGKYRVSVSSAGDYEKMMELASWLVAKETS
jgi:thiol:disulfide interchange protein DsbA